MKFGITLSNRGVLVGLCTPRDLLVLSDAIEAAPVFDRHIHPTEPRTFRLTLSHRF